MGSQRYTPEFKDEAIRQIMERGYAIADVAERLGVSAHSLYKWVKAVTPTKCAQHSQELVVAKSKILKLRGKLQRTKEERDILKRRPRTLRANRSKVRLHERASQ